MIDIVIYVFATIGLLAVICGGWGLIETMTEAALSKRAKHINVCIDFHKVSSRIEELHRWLNKHENRLHKLELANIKQNEAI